MNLALTYYGEKPCSVVEINYFSQNPLNNLDRFQKAKQEMSKALEKTGLNFIIVPQEGTNENEFDYKIRQFFVSRDKNKLLALKKPN